MKRLCLAVLVAQLLCISCHSPPAGAKEPNALCDADQLFNSGKYDAALAKYESALRSGGDERGHLRALFGAFQCELGLGKLEAAVDRVRAAAPPADASLRGLWALSRFKLLQSAQHMFGFATETEEGTTGAGKLSKGEVTREIEAAMQSLWSDRQALVRSPLGDWKNFLALDGVDFVRVPSLWDFTVPELQNYLQYQSGNAAPSDPLVFTGEQLTSSFDATQPPLMRAAALAEAGATLDGGHVDRAVAAERWRVTRVLYGERLTGNSATQAFRSAAIARLTGWVTTMKTPLGRAAAAEAAARLLCLEERRTDALALIDRLLPATPESDVAVSLRQERADIVRPELRVQTMTTRHGQKALHMTTRNLATIALRLYRVEPLADGGKAAWTARFVNPQLAQVAATLASGKPAAQWSVATGDKGDHRARERDLDLPASTPLGLYLVLACDDGKFQLRHSQMQAAYVNVTSLAIARVQTDRGLRVYAFDADAAEPPSDVMFHLRTQSNWNGASHVEERAGGRDAVIDWRRGPQAGYTQVDTLATRGEAVALFDQMSWLGAPRAPTPFVLYVTSDRPIYRPGQTLHARVTSIERTHDGSFKVDAQRPVRLALLDTSNKEVASKAVVTGAMGSAATELEIPASGLLGRYSVVASMMTASDVTQSLPVRVEEYKRPEFEVTLAGPTTAARYGHAAKLSGAVKYYFGGAAADVVVKFKVSRQRWIPWWSWRSHASAKVEIARGQVETDKRGKFEVGFVASPDPEAKPSDDPDAPDVSDFIVEVEAHDAGGRTITAERSLRVGRQALLASIDSAHGFYFSDEQPQLQVKATNLAEQPQATTLQWTLERLAAPKSAPGEQDDAQAAQDQPLQAQLAQFPVAPGAPVATGQVHTSATSPARLPLPALPAGGYRVRLQGGDAKASFAFVVVDAKTRALPLPLPALAIARDTAAQPGDKVQLLLGDSAGTGAYHLELWRGTHLVSHRIERGAPLRVVTIPVDAALAGGFTARWIGARGLRVIGADATLRVERKDKVLTVQLVGQPAALEPGQKAHWSLQVRDGKGRPVGGEALVKIYDRSLDLYANDGPSSMYTPQQGSRWAEELWAPPDDPLPRQEGVRRGWAQAMPGDEAARVRQDKAIAGSYTEPQTPRFKWEEADAQALDVRRFSGGMANRMTPAPAMPMAAYAHAPRERGEPLRKVVSGATVGLVVAGAPPPPPAAASAQPPPAADESAARTNMAETALFAPDVQIGDDGKGAFELHAPERLTSWRVQVLALGHRVEAGRVESTFVTRKPLMVRVEIPRFFREGDRSQIAAIVHNETAQPLSADVDLAVRDDASGHSALAALGIADGKRHVDVPAHDLVAIEYPIVAPENLAHYIVRASARAGKLADAEERTLPLLPSRERLVQSQVVALRGNEEKTIEFPELTRQPHNQDASLRSDSLTVSIDPELALSVLRAIPSLVEYPYECAEQTVNRYVPLAIVARIYAEHPELARAIAATPQRQTAHEPWAATSPQDDARRLVTLMETPWLADAQGGGSDAHLRGLFNPRAVQTMGKAALEKLARMQRSDGSFPWFPGGQANLYMTLYVLEQLGMLQELGIDAPPDVVGRALDYAAAELGREPTKPDEASLAFLAYGSYVLTSFDGARYPAVKTLRPEVQAWMKRVVANKLILTPFGRAWSARVMARLGDQATAMMLLESALDGAKRDPVIGVYWTPERYAWLWYADSIEKHAFFLRTLAELKPDDERVPGMLQWLLFNRKGNEWHSTKASAAAIYSILALMRKQGALTQPEKFHVVWDKQEELVTVKPTEDRRQPLMWTVRGRDVTPARGRVQVGKTGPGIAFASATWVYSSTKLQEAHGSSLLDVSRVYYRRVHEADGDHLQPLKSGDQVHVGDDLEVRLTVKAKSQLEFVHVKEPRGAGFEETTLTSGYRWNRVPAYEEPRDTLFNFFLDWLPAGEVELRHSLRPTTPGRYRIGSAVVQSMYSPDVSAFSAGMELQVVK